MSQPIANNQPQKKNWHYKTHEMWLCKISVKYRREEIENCIGQGVPTSVVSGAPKSEEIPRGDDRPGKPDARPQGTKTNIGDPMSSDPGDEIVSTITDPASRRIDEFANRTRHSELARL